MALPKNRPAVQKLLKELEPLILGKEHKGMSCGCGAISSGRAKAVRIIPSGDSYPSQETHWWLWSVDMQPIDDKDSGWSGSLSSFIDSKQLKSMFGRYFSEQDQKEKNPYSLKIRGTDRLSLGLPTAVRIQENDNQIRFSFNWGYEQSTAARLFELYLSSGRRIYPENNSFAGIINLLKAIQPYVYSGGPDPELPYESNWLIDYNSALRLASTQVKYIFFQNLGHSGDEHGLIYIDMDVVFSKVEIK